MRYGLTYRDRLRALSVWLEEEWDRLVAALASWQAVEHHDDGTHAAVTADSLTVGTLTGTDATLSTLTATTGTIGTATVTSGTVTTLSAGHLTLSETEWEDLRFPAVGINPPGAGSDPTRDNTDGRLIFANGADKIIAIQAQLPHGWKEGTAIVPHVHWSPVVAASGNVRWKLEWKIANINETFPGSWGSETISAPSSGVADRHEYDSFSAISMTGKTYSCMIMFLLTRLASSDAADTYEQNVKLLEFDLHYQHYRFGSS